MSLNKVMLIGNVGQNPEVRYLNESSGGAKVATFSVATTERYKDRSGQTTERTEWHNIVTWRGLADTVEQYVKKGTQVYIEGRLRTRSWEDQNHNKRYTTEIVADNLQLLGRRSDNPATQQGGYGQQTAQGSYAQPAAQGYQAQQGSYAQPAAAGPQGNAQPSAPSYGAPAAAPAGPAAPNAQPYPQPAAQPAAPVAPQQPAAPQIDEPDDDLPF